MTYINKLTDEKRRGLIALHCACFNETPEYAEWFFGENFKNIFSWFHTVDGKTVCAVYARPVRLVNENITVPFFTGICTHPDYRYKGLAKNLIFAAVADLKENYPFALLHPFNAEFYTKLGFLPFNFCTEKKEETGGNKIIKIDGSSPYDEFEKEKFDIGLCAFGTPDSRVYKLYYPLNPENTITKAYAGYTKNGNIIVDFLPTY